MIPVPIFLRRRPAQVIAGAGLLSRSMGTGKNSRSVIYSAISPRQFKGAWTPQARLIGDAVEADVQLGFVNALEPVNGDGQKISEGGVVKGQFGDGDEMWLVLKVQIDPETGKMTALNQDDVSPENLTLEFTESLIKADNEYGYAPLAYLTRPKGILKVFQIAYFSYRHSTGRDRFGGPWRHFFHVA